MKTTQDFINNFEQYAAQIEREIATLNSMRKEFRANCITAQKIIKDIEPVLAKLHLTIYEFTMNRPDREIASNRGNLNLTLLPDGKFKFIKDCKNENRLEEVYTNKGKYIGRFIEGKKYQVRKTTEEDCENFENYCVVNGLFFDEIFLSRPLPSKLLNRYTGTHHLHAIISKEVVKRHLVYIEKL